MADYIEHLKDHPVFPASGHQAVDRRYIKVPRVISHNVPKFLIYWNHCSIFIVI
jgi:hypothetical protein